MRVLYKCIRYAENNKYYVSLMFANVLEHNNNVETTERRICESRRYIDCTEK